MSQTIDNLRNNFQTKLNAIASHLDTVKTHLEDASKEAKTAIHSKLDVAKGKLEAKKQEIANAKTKLEERVEAKKTEVESQIADWKAKREQKKLTSRANRAEEYAAAAIVVAFACVEEAEVAILEAVAARIDAEIDEN